MLICKKTSREYKTHELNKSLILLLSISSSFLSISAVTFEEMTEGFRVCIAMTFVTPRLPQRSLGRAADLQSALISSDRTSTSSAGGRGFDARSRHT